MESPRLKKPKVYEYAGCSTCKKALKFLEARGIAYEKIDITAKAPSAAELKQMAKQMGSIRPLFNTSGQVYREMKLGEKLPGMTDDQAIALLAGNGRLVKRPFVVGDGWGLVGFREEDWKSRLKG